MARITFFHGLNGMAATLDRFRRDDRGSIAFFALILFVLMLIFGGIAVDVMRFETRRVALQQTLDRAALAAASLTQTRPPTQIAEDWFAKADLGADLPTVTIATPAISAISTENLRRVSMSAEVRSHNFFMSIFSDADHLESPAATEAIQGLSNIEVMLVLDITGSMQDPAGNGLTKIQALRQAATDFVNIVKSNDSRNAVSIGLVPYSSQVNIPENLRQQFQVLNLSHWNGVANAGVPNLNCIEIPTGTYGSTALSTQSPMRMAAVADTESTTPTNSSYLAPGPYAPSTNPLHRICNTAPNAPTANHVMLPTKDAAPVIQRISDLQAGGYTSIALGMRWGTALLDQAARPIYATIGDPSVAGRPADNDSQLTRKIIVLMTDGEHFQSRHILDAYKTGPSPIWRGSDGNYAIRFVAGGPAGTNRTRPACAGTNTYFVPHLKDAWVDLNQNGKLDSGGAGNEVGACDSDAWRATAAWTATVPDGPDPDSNPDIVMITATQLDWSEVWASVRLSWVVRQLYMRANVGMDYGSGVWELARTYLSDGTLNSLLQQNCTAARAQGIEIYGIAFQAPQAGQTQIYNCASSPQSTYYFNATDGDDLTAVFQTIATDLSDLRLSQ